MATNTITRKHVKYGDPGVVFAAPLGSLFPTPAVASATIKKFTHTWDPLVWRVLGAMEEGEGFTFGMDVDTDDVNIEDSLDLLDIVTTGRNLSVSFTLAERSPKNIALALNGDQSKTLATTTTTGGGSFTTVKLPKLSEETYTMLGWQSLKDDEVMGFYLARQVGNLELKRGKGSAKTVLACEFRILTPDTAVADTPVWWHLADQ